MGNFPDDVLWETGINLDIVAAIADSVEAAVTPAGYIPGEIYEHRKRIIDVTVLRYPDTEYSYFKVSVVASVTVDIEKSILK